MADTLARNDGLLRLADTALRTAGGRAVLLRMAAPAATGDDAEQLGLATPMFSDAELAPAVVKKTASETTVIVAASAIVALTGTLAFDSAEVLLATAAGVVIGGTLFELLGWSVTEAYGRPYAYYLTLQRTNV